MSYTPNESGEQDKRDTALTAALHELDATPDELREWAPVVRRLDEWSGHALTAVDEGRLLAALAPYVPAPSPVRQAIRARMAQRSGQLGWLIETARTQVSLFGLDFWLVSALITLVGVVVALSNALPDQGLILRASGPLLAYLGTVVAFRGREAGTLELELACLPSPLQLAIARLVIVLGYDIGLGAALSLALWAGGARDVLALLLSWLMPLLLVAGLALLLSLRLPIQAAASLAYGGWLAFLAIGVTPLFPALPLTPLSELLLGAVGLALLAVALLRLHTSMWRLLPIA
ncbi:MAG TPA: hypothetical protein VMV29_11745 [Ktedonobacterales bacterium]|nr:hypothetical protein [Ktedonobacterales bacterium]